MQHLQGSGFSDVGGAARRWFHGNILLHATLSDWTDINLQTERVALKGDCKQRLFKVYDCGTGRVGRDNKGMRTRTGRSVAVLY